VAVRDSINCAGVVLGGPLVLFVLYLCLNRLLAIGDITIFDARRGLLQSRVEGWLKGHYREMPLGNVINVYAEGGSIREVYLATSAKDIKICWFSNVNARQPAVEAAHVVQAVRTWLLSHQILVQTQPPEPVDADLVPIANPTLAYLLRQSPLPLIVERSTQPYLRIDLISGTERDRRGVRRFMLSPALEVALLPRLFALCHVDVELAYQAAPPAQRAAINALLGR
jgi:hypothetical protein